MAALSSAALLSLGAATSAHADGPDNGYYNKMTNLNSGMCAAVGNNSTSPGAGLIQFPCDNKYNKQFAAGWAGSNAYFLRIRSDNQCVTVQSWAEHALVVQSYCANSDAQVWVAESLGNDSYRLRNRASGLCLTAAWGMTNSGQPLDQSTCGGFNGQAWRFSAMHN
ncbi:RICIN domain-containing protein [Streptomyces sp. H10-C2]|uniref:RICIN domain-containing protein n=1 Tax=unclassified Streptomyces TaxID=2593676 RepID=UPI0024BBB971|nr:MULTISPECIES: RICIN domain-containing protein [unclassified Streptomyces]MDJ0343916.1 RICIN domain-containing protein [Streptomyces sp. PH10-H1]MDJ0373357.1 RICIN domain-containing protein [Streptomyces sp. H10-C2]